MFAAGWPGRALPLLLFLSLPALAEPVWTHIADYTDTRAMVATRDGLVGASSRGAWLYSPQDDRWEHVSLPQGLASIDLTQVCVDGEGTAFWAGSDASVSAMALGGRTLSRGFFEFREHPQIQAVEDLQAVGELVIASHSTGLSVFDYLPESDEFLVEWNLHVFGQLPAQNPVLAATAVDDWLVVAGAGGLAWGRGWPAAPAQFTSWLNPGGLGSVAAARLQPTATGAVALLEAADGAARAWRFEDGAWSALWPDETLDDVRGFAAGERSVVALAEGLGSRLLFDDGQSLSLDRKVGALAWAGDTLWIALAPDRRAGGLLAWTAQDGFGEERSPQLPGAEEFVDLDLDAQGRLWTAGVAEDLGRNGLFRLEADGAWTAVRLGMPYFGNYPTSLHCDSERGVWFGGWGRGLGWIDVDGGPGDTLLFNADSSLYDTQWLYGYSNSTGGSSPTFVLVSDVEEDAEGNVWVVNHQALNDSCFVVIPAAWRHDRTRPFARAAFEQDRTSFPYWLLPAGEGEVWAGVGGKDTRDTFKRVVHLTDRGLPATRVDEWTLRDATLSSAAFNFGIEESGTTTALALDADGQVWVGTDAGVYYGGVYGGVEQFSRVQFIPGLLSEAVSSLAADRRGRVWMGSSEGLNVFLPRELRFAEPLEVELFNGFARDRGLKINKILLREDTGEIWLATNLGLFHCDSGARSYGTALANDVKCQPNPFRPDVDGRVRVRAESLVDDGMVAIYELGGRLLKQFSLDEAERGWDGRDADGRLVDTGVYMVLVTSDSGSASGKLAVVR